MNKNEMIKEYGNDLIAYDVTDMYKPLVLCYVDDERVLAYDVNKNKYSLVQLYSYVSNEGYYFVVDGSKRMNMR